jgi:hypothetical protein
LVKKDKLISKDFNKFAKMKVASIGRRFGGWEKALIAAGIGHKYSGIRISDKMRQQNKKLTDENILNELKRIAHKLGQNFVTQENVNSNSEIISGSTIVYRFGSWENGVKKAGLENSPGYRRTFSDEEYIENLLNVWTYHGRQPFYREMDEPPSKRTSGAYEARFGSWRKALEAFVTRMNEGETENNEEINPRKTITESADISLLRKRQESKHKIITQKTEDRRGINLSLRYKVLVRDDFRCVRCGRSPATSSGLELHIDHKNPVSNQGKTTFENLETKCKECNLGKGNRHIE